MSKKIISTLSLVSLVFISGCSSTSEDSSLRKRTLAEEEAIHNAWYPIKNKECQLLVDSMTLAQAAIGSNESQYIADNMEVIKSRLKMTEQVTSRAIFELSQSTNEPSIREYAIEAVPLFASLSSMFASDSEDFSSQLKYLAKFKALTDKIPDACKS